MADSSDQDRYIHLKEIFIDFIKRRPSCIMELVFKDDSGAEHQSKRFKKGDPVHWKLDTYVRNHTSATLTTRRALFKIRIAEIEVDFEPNEFRDDRAVRLEDSNHRVAVHLMCGTSQSFENVPRLGVLGSQSRTGNALSSKILRFLKYPRLAAPPPHATIHGLNDDILLGIFNCYRLNDMHWNDRLGWCKLSHVCQRWRYLIYESTFLLRMHIQCTRGTPIVDMLDHLPPLPLVVNYVYTSVTILTEQDESGIYQALRLRDRLRHINLHLRPSILYKCLGLMDTRFPVLEHLSLSFATDEITTLTLPQAFLAPNLRYLSFPRITPPERLRFLTSAVSLVTLVLWDIQHSSYFRPTQLLACVSSLPQLEKLSIGFSTSIPRPSTETELLGDQGTPATLPKLKSLWFQGVSAYLECLVAQMSAPLLDRLDITLFNQITFTLTHLSHFISRTERFTLSTARVSFDRDEFSIVTKHHNTPGTDRRFIFHVMCHQLDRQIDCAAHICRVLIPALSSVERFTLDFYDDVLPIEWRNGEIGGRRWRELLRSFIGMKELHVDDAFLMELSRALQVVTVMLDPHFLPDLRDIVAEDNMFASFINTRRLVGRPVRFSSPPPPSWRADFRQSSDSTQAFAAILTET